MEKINYDVIFVLVNPGFTEIVMEAAKANGAKGGTIINCRGSSNDIVAKSYGLLITPEKQLIMILVQKEIKEKVINAIYKVAGIETKAMGLIASMPVSNVIGIKKSETESEKTEVSKGDNSEKIQDKKVSKKGKK